MTARTPSAASLFLALLVAGTVSSARAVDGTSGGGCPAVTLAPAALPSGTFGVPYSQTITAIGGAAPYTFVVTSGALPPGLALSPGGGLSGAPTAAGFYSFVVRATDVAGCTGQRSYGLIVNPPGCGAILISPSTLPGGMVSTAYSQTLTSSGGTPPYSYALASGSLPTGIGLNASGVISGTLGNADVYRFTVIATDFSGCIGAGTYDLVVTDVGDTLAGQGLGSTNANRVKAYDAAGTSTSTDFLAYGAGNWGVNVVSANVDAFFHDEILTGPGPGAVFGPQVRGFLRDGTPIAKVDFYAYGTLKFGVNVARGDVDLDHSAEILTGPGPGVVFGPHVRGWNYDGAALAPITRINFYAYGTLAYGVNAAGADVDGDLYDEIVTGPGPGIVFAPQIHGYGYDNASVAPLSRINYQAFATAQYGANVAGGNVDGDGYDEIVCTPGPGPGTGFPSRFLGFDYDDATIAPLPGYDITPFATLYGGRVGLGDLDLDLADDLLAAAGRDAAADSTIKPYRYGANALTALPGSFVAFPGSTYGVNAAGARLGY